MIKDNFVFPAHNEYLHWNKVHKLEASNNIPAHTNETKF